MKLKHTPKLDPQFMPLSVLFRDAKNSPSKEITIALERNRGLISVFTTCIPDVDFETRFSLCERLVKTLLWLKGGFKIYFAGDDEVGNALTKEYSNGGPRDFDFNYMAGIYRSKFEVIVCSKDEIPAEKEDPSSVGRNLDGCRIGFDAGGSDRKVSAVIDGKAVYSEEVVWFPKLNSDPNYHYQGILEAFKTAASKIP